MEEARQAGLAVDDGRQQGEGVEHLPQVAAGEGIVLRVGLVPADHPGHAGTAREARDQVREPEIVAGQGVLREERDIGPVRALDATVACAPVPEIRLRDRLRRRPS